MKRRLLLFLGFLLFSFVFADDAKVDILRYFFLHSDYSQMTTSLQNSKGINLRLAYEKTDGSSDVVTRAVVYATQDKKTVIYAYILGPYVISSNGDYLIDVASAPGVFWGWKITESKNKNTGISQGLVFTYLGDNGDRVNDIISLIWTKNLNRFSVITADRSQW
jgi:hypothetical protein